MKMHVIIAGMLLVVAGALASEDFKFEATINGVATKWQKKPDEKTMAKLEAILKGVPGWTEEFLNAHRSNLYKSYVEQCKALKHKPVPADIWESAVMRRGLPSKIEFIDGALPSGRNSNQIIMCVGTCYTTGDFAYWIKMGFQAIDGDLGHELGHGIFRAAVRHGAGTRGNWANGTQAGLMEDWVEFFSKKAKAIGKETK